MNAPDPKYLVMLTGVTFAGVAAWTAFALTKFKEPWARAVADGPAEEAKEPKEGKAKGKGKTAPAPEPEADDEDGESDEAGEDEAGDEAPAKR